MENIMCDSDSGLSLSMNDSQADIRCQKVFIRVTCPELEYESIQSFSATTLVFDVKLIILKQITTYIRDKWNFGLFLPPSKGKAGKFLQEERLLCDYPFDNSVGHLELKYKQRVYRMLRTNANKLKKVHIRSNLRQFLDCVKNGEVEKVSKWLNKGLDPNFQWKDTGETPLTMATKLEKPREMIMALVAGGAHLDYRSTDTMTPLHRAAAVGNHEAIKVLLDLGQSPNTRDQYHLTPLYYAVLNDTTALCTERLLYDHAFLGTVDEAGLQEVHQACRFGRVQHLETLIFYGADINSQTSKNGNTPLHICAFTGQEACARLLLFRGADRTLLNRAGHTPYQQAVLAQHCSVADVIDTFDGKDVVPIRGSPKRNERRRPNMDCYVQQQQQQHSILGRLTASTNGLDGQTSLSSRLSLDAGNCISSSVSRGSEIQLVNSQIRTSISGYCLDSILGGPVNGGDNHERTIGCRKAPNSEQRNPVSLSQSSYNLGNAGTDERSGTGIQDYTGTMQITSHQSTRKLTRFNGCGGRPTLESMWALPNSENASDTASIFSGASSIRGGHSVTTYGSTSSTLQMVLRGQANILELDTTNLPRMIVLQKGPRGFGFVIRGRKGVPGKFKPTIEFPALQYLEKIETGSAADRAGLKPGDYILEVNGINVTTMSHESVVQIIRNSGDILSMKVITLDSGGHNYSTGALDNDDQTCQQVTSYGDKLAHSISKSNGGSQNLAETFDVYSSPTTSTVHSISTRLLCESQNDPYATISRGTAGRKDTEHNSTGNMKSGSVIMGVTSIPGSISHTSLPSPPPLLPSTQPPPPPPLPLTPAAASLPQKHDGLARQIPHSGQSEFATSSKSSKTSPPEAVSSVGSTATLPPPPPLHHLPNVQIKAESTSRKTGHCHYSQEPALDRAEEDASPPLPPPPPLDSPDGHQRSECGSPKLMRRKMKQMQDPHNIKDARATFEDHLRQAVERRRKKLEITSSEDEETRSKADTKDFQDRSANNSVLYSAGDSSPRPTVRLHDGTFPTNDLRRKVSISQTGESSFKVAAEKFHAKALARSMGISTSTIPPPENFKDKNSSPSVMELARTFNTQCGVANLAGSGACIKKSFSTYFADHQAQSSPVSGMSQVDSQNMVGKFHDLPQASVHSDGKRSVKPTIPPPPPLPSRPSIR